MTQILVLIVVVAGALWASRSWRTGLEAALILVVLEGALRKWLVPGASSYIYFAKDFLLLGVYLGYLRDRRQRQARVRLPQGLVAALALTLAIGLLQVFNPHLPNLLVGLLGLKAYFLYVPLLWVVPAAFRSEAELLAFLKRYLLLAVPIGLLAVMQFVSPPDSRWNTYARGGSSDNPMSAITFGSGTRVRVTGTFSFITGYGSYLQVISLLAMTLLTVRGWRLRGSLQTYAALAFTAAGMLMTGSRGPVFTLLLMLPIYGILGAAREGGVPAAARFLLGLGLVASFVNVVGADAVSAFRARAAGSEDVAGRIIQPFTVPFQIAPEIGFTGYGIGASHQMAEVVAPSLAPYSWLEGFHYENEPSKIMVELGMIGFVSWFAGKIALILFSLRALLSLRRPLPRVLALSCLLLFLSQLTGGVVFNVTGGLYYWYFGGLLFLAIRLDRQAAVSGGRGGRGGPGGPAGLPASHVLVPRIQPQSAP